MIALLLTLTFDSRVLAQDSMPVLHGKVTRIVDGDTIHVLLSSGDIAVRLHGIDTPERGQPWEDEATAAMARMVLGKQVDLEPFEQDRYNRLVAIVLVGDLDVNSELLRLGHAWPFRRYMRKREDAFLCELEYEARTAKRGLWGLPKDRVVAPWEWRRRKSVEEFTDYSTQTTAACSEALGKG